MANRTTRTPEKADLAHHEQGPNDDHDDARTNRFGHGVDRGSAGRGVMTVSTGAEVS
jgi:hypothetical protein